MESKRIPWTSSFPNGDLDSFKPIDQKTLMVAWDTEYTRRSETTNLGLSYQFSALDCSTGFYMKKIYYPNLGSEERLTFKEIILQVFEMMFISPKNMSDYHLLFVCHFCSAEFAMLRDRKEVARHLDFLYKTVITFNVQRLTFTLENGDTCELTFEVGDTMLLLPPTHKSLEKASSLLDEKFHKKELTAEEKERMDLLLQRDPERFAEYGIHDADITLRLFIKLQYTLNIMNGSEGARFTTIGSATIKHFVKQMDKELFKSQFGKSNEVYLEDLSLVKLAYAGGLNSSYFVGECEGELFLDIDFSSAYPTVMNLLEISVFGVTVKKLEKSDDDDFSLGDTDD